MKDYMTQLQHQWSSIESRAISYNQFWRDGTAAKFVEDFIKSNPGVGGHFDSKRKAEQHELLGDQDIDVDEYNGRNTMHELGRWNMATAFYHHEVYQEMVLRNHVDSVTFGPKESEDDPRTKISFKDSMEKYMEDINTMRKDELYKHTEEDCSQICRARGCGKVATIDGGLELCCHEKFQQFWSSPNDPSLNSSNTLLKEDYGCCHLMRLDLRCDEKVPWMIHGGLANGQWPCPVEDSLEILFVSLFWHL